MKRWIAAAILAVIGFPAGAQQPDPVWGSPVSSFATSFNAAARRLQLTVRAVEVECGTTQRTICRYNIGPASLLVQSPVGSETVQQLLLAIPQTQNDQMQSLMALETIISMAEPGADQPERSAVIRSLFTLSGPSSRPITANLGTSSFETNIAPPLGFMITAFPKGLPRPQPQPTPQRRRPT